MRCVACGYTPTRAEQLEQPYGCRRCEPNAFRPSLARATADCVVSLGQLCWAKVKGTSYPSVASRDDHQGNPKP